MKQIAIAIALLLASCGRTLPAFAADPPPAAYAAVIVLTDTHGQVVEVEAIGATSTLDKCTRGVMHSFEENQELVDKVRAAGGILAGYCLNLLNPVIKTEVPLKDETRDPRLTPEQAEQPRTGA